MQRLGIKLLTWEGPTSRSYTYYSDTPVEVGDKVIVTTRYGTMEGIIDEVIGWNDAWGEEYPPGVVVEKRQKVIQNVTKQIKTEGCLMLVGYRAVRVRHLNSDRTNVVLVKKEDLVTRLSVGSFVVYEAPTSVSDMMDERARRPRRKADQFEYLSINDNMPAGLHVGQVTDLLLDNADAESQYFIVAIIDLSDANLQRERIKEIKQLRTELELKRRQYEDRAVLEMIAAKDPEAAEILSRLDSLTK